MNTIIMKNGVTVITPNQDLTDKNADVFKSEISKQTYSTVTLIIELDLSNIRQVDSVGLGVIMAMHRVITKSGRTLVVSGVSADIYGLMKTMRLDRMLEIKEMVTV